MDDSQFVDIFYARDYLLEESAGLFLFEPGEMILPLILYDVLKELTSRSIFSDQVQMCWIFNDLD